MLTVYDGQAVLVAMPRQSTSDINRFRAKHQIRAEDQRRLSRERDQ